MNIQFICSIQTDDFVASSIYVGLHKAISTSSVFFSLDNFHSDEVETYLRPCAIGLAKKHVFTVTLSPQEFEVKRCGAKERQCYAGIEQRAEKVEKLKEEQGMKKSRQTCLPIKQSIDKRWASMSVTSCNIYLLILLL